MATERTRDSAWKAVVKKRSEVAKQILDQNVRDLMTEALVEEIFEAEWTSQFEDDRSPVQAKIRQIVNDRLDERKLGEGPK